jgi:hypothetical protein
MKNKVLKIFNKKIILEDSSDKELLKGITTDVVGDVSSFMGDSSKFLSQLAKFTIKSGWLTFRAKILKNMSDEDFKRALKDARVSFVDSSDRTISNIDNTTKSMLNKAGISNSELSTFALSVPGVTIFDKINLSDLLTGKLYNKNLYAKYNNIDHDMYQLIIFWMIYEIELISNEDNKIESPTKTIIDQLLRKNIQKVNKLKPKLNLFLSKKAHPEFFDIMNNEVLKKKDKETFNLIKKVLENRTYTSYNIIKNKTSKKFLEKLKSYLKSIKKTSLVDTKKNESSYRLKKVLQINNKNIILKENIGNDFEIDKFASLILELSNSIAVAVLLENEEIQKIINDGKFDFKTESLKQVNKNEKTNKKFNDLGDKIENSSESEKKDLNNKTFEIEKSDEDLDKINKYYKDQYRLASCIIIDLLLVKAVNEYNLDYGVDKSLVSNTDFKKVNKIQDKTFNELIQNKIQDNIGGFLNYIKDNDLKGYINDYLTDQIFIDEKDIYKKELKNFEEKIDDLKNSDDKLKQEEISNIKKSIQEDSDSYIKQYYNLLLDDIKIKSKDKNLFKKNIDHNFEDFKNESSYKTFKDSIENSNYLQELEKIITDRIIFSLKFFEMSYQEKYIAIFNWLNTNFMKINELENNEDFINEILSTDDDEISNIEGFIQKEIAETYIKVIEYFQSLFSKEYQNVLKLYDDNKKMTEQKYNNLNDELDKRYEDLEKIDGLKYLSDTNLFDIDYDPKDFQKSEYGKKLKEINNSSFSETKKMLQDFNEYVFKNNSVIKDNYLKDSIKRVQVKNTIDDKIKKMKL